MKTTIRYGMFETNSSSEHVFILISKETFEAWKRGEKKLYDNWGENLMHCDNGAFIESVKNELHECEEGKVYREKDFADAKDRKRYSNEWSNGTYEDVMDFLESGGGSSVRKSAANKEYVNPEEWEMTDDDDFVVQYGYTEIKDDGKNVMIHSRGR
ncbi:MAG: hypothetical protein FWG58_04570 [Methanomassiliicoccaceae archaeon]|nr:hypothetical protein [Methanomassiliicoccaceae archaeon]